MKSPPSAPAQSTAAPPRKSCYPGAYHIIWGTYGGRLPGSTKKHVTPEQNEYGTPLPPRNARRESEARSNMGHEAVRLTLEQRKVVESAMINVAKRYSWTIHAIAPQSDHEHVVTPRVGLVMN